MARDLHMNYLRIGSLSVAKALHEFIQQAAAPGTSISAEAFWSGFAELLRECGTRNRQLLQVRDELQSRIDQYHRERSGEPLDLGDYERFLRDIGYVLPEGNDFAIRTTNIDDEIAVVAGPQLVVPLSNARYALNAANARWGSLYDALYGTDAIPEDGGATRTGTYNKIRGERVVARGRAMLDETVPLARGSHRDVVSYSVEGVNLLVRLRDGTSTGLARPAQFAGYRREASAPSAVLLRNHGLHLEIKIDRVGGSPGCPRSRTRGWRTVTAPMPVATRRSATSLKCPQFHIRRLRGPLGFRENELGRRISRIQKDGHLG